METLPAGVADPRLLREGLRPGQDQALGLPTQDCGKPSWDPSLLTDEGVQQTSSEFSL